MVVFAFKNYANIRFPKIPLIVKKESWTRYWTKAITILGILVVSGMLFATRFKIVGDPQKVKCIPAYSVYLLDYKDRNLERGKLYVFKAKDLSPIYEKDTYLLKYLQGMPGDEIEVQKSEQILVNGQYKEFGLPYAKEKLGKSKEDFVGKTVLKENQYWFLGTSVKSFDSRYWGSVGKEQIVGRAYPLF